MHGRWERTVKSEASAIELAPAVDEPDDGAPVEPQPMNRTVAIRNDATRVLVMA